MTSQQQNHTYCIRRQARTLRAQLAIACGAVACRLRPFAALSWKPRRICTIGKQCGSTRQHRGRDLGSDGGGECGKKSALSEGAPSSSAIKSRSAEACMTQREVEIARRASRSRAIPEMRAESDLLCRRHAAVTRFFHRRCLVSDRLSGNIFSSRNWIRLSTGFFTLR